MLRLFVLLTAVVCCNACRIELFPTQDTTSSPQVCTDSDGNLHEFYSEWESGPETCVCVDFGYICCERFEEPWRGTEHDYITVGDAQYDHDDSAAQPTTDDVTEDTE